MEILKIVKFLKIAKIQCFFTAASQWAQWAQWVRPGQAAVRFEWSVNLAEYIKCILSTATTILLHTPIPRRFLPFFCGRKSGRVPRGPPPAGRVLVVVYYPNGAKLPSKIQSH